jgi:hypothetical protein
MGQVFQDPLARMLALAEIAAEGRLSYQLQ